MSRLWLLIAMCCFACTGYAERLEQLNSPLPDSFVADRIGLLAEDSRAELDRLAAALDSRGLGQLAVVVIATTDGVDQRQFATELFNRWGVGDAQRNDGSLILLANADRAAEIVLGTGIDNAANRSHAEQIMQTLMVPQFRQSKPDLALLNGATALLQRIYGLDLALPVEQPASAPLAAPLTPTPTQNDEETPWFGLAIIAAIGGALLFVGWLVFGWLWRVLRRIWSVAGSLWWLTGARWRQRRCHACSAPTTLLTGAAREHQLSAEELTEERLRSVAHRVYECAGCGEVAKVAHRTLLNKYESCECCGARAQYREYEVLEEASYGAKGTMRVHTRCEHCGRHISEQQSLRRRRRRQRYRSSSNGSFGGGSSSGGGASGRW